VSWTNTRQTTDEGSVLLHSTGRDVTARVRAQRALSHSEALLEKTGRAAGVGGWELDIRSGEVIWTAETRRIHEVPADFRPTLERALDFYAPASRPVVEAAVQRGLTEGAPWDLELQLLTARGRSIWARAVGEVEFEGGRPVRMFGAFQDVTERRAAEQSRRQIAAIFDNSSDFIVQADRQRLVRYMNPAAARVLLGRPWPGADADGQADLPVASLLPEATQRKFDDTILPALQAHGVWVGQSMILDAQRRELPASHMVIAHRDDQGEIERFSIIWRDVSDLVAAQAERERQARTLRSVTDAIPATVAVLDRDGRYAMANPAFARSLGLSADHIVGRTAREVLGEQEFEARRPWIERAFAGETVRFERQRSDAASVRSIVIDYLPLRTAGGESEGFVVVGQDITELREEQDRLQLLSQTDALTQLLNRAGFERRLQHHLDPLTDEPVALLYCDLDRFKPVNDTHGHAAGDALLRLVARRLVRLVRPSDVVARLGGDEFALALPGMRELADARRVGQAIVDALQQPFQITDNVVVQIGCSVGVALRQPGDAGATGLLARADRALYDAKRGGRNRVAVAPAESG
jgi:diguanylate cyclase (GGDEF)-like protein/PAS domain S-box-containing protein